MIETFIGTGIFLLLGLFLILHGLRYMSYEKRFLSGDVSVVRGKITEICKHKTVLGRRRIVWYTASVEYWVNGEMYRISGTDTCLKQYIYVNKNAYKAGDIVEIAYRNDKTKDCIIKGNNYGKRGILVILFGTIFIIITLCHMINLF